MRATPPRGASADSGTDYTAYNLTLRDNDKAKLTVASKSTSVVESEKACFRLDVEDIFFHPSQGYNFAFRVAVTEEGGFLAASQLKSMLRTIHQVDEIDASDTDYDVCVDLDDDHVDEVDGSVTMRLKGPTTPGFEIGADSTASVTVTDNDDPSITVTVQGGQAIENSRAAIVFKRHGILTEPLSVQSGDTKIDNGPALSDSDYQDPTSSKEDAFTFPAGDATVSVNKGIGDDAYYFPDEYLEVIFKARAGSYATPPTLPANAVAELSDSTKTVYRFPISQNDSGKVSITAIDTEVDESEQACYEIDSNAYIDFSYTVTLKIAEEADFLSSGQGRTLTRAISDAPHEVCIDLDDDDESEAPAYVTAKIANIYSSDPRMVVNSSADSASVRVTDNDLPIITLTTETTSITEGVDTEVLFTLTRTGDVSKEFTITRGHLEHWISEHNVALSLVREEVVFCGR